MTMVIKISVSFILLGLCMIQPVFCQTLLYGKERPFVRDEGKSKNELRRCETELSDTKNELQRSEKQALDAQTESRRYKMEVSIIQNELGRCKNDIESFKATNATAKIIQLSSIILTRNNDYAGGRAGHAFNDITAWMGDHITSIQLGCSDRFLITVRMKYGSRWGPEHGIEPDDCDWWKRGIDYRTYTLSTNEYVTSIETTEDSQFLKSVIFRTNNRVLPRCGSSIGTTKTASGTKLLYISGKAGCIIDGLQPHWLQL